MSEKAANTLKSMYYRHIVTEKGLQKAVEDGVITQSEYEEIMNTVADSEKTSE
jgi:hypothetical protein